MRTIRSLFVAALCLAAVTLTAQVVQPDSSPTVASDSARTSRSLERAPAFAVTSASDVAVDVGRMPFAPLSLMSFALIGMTAPPPSTKPAPKAKTKKVNLAGSYLFNGQTYGPGADIVVPADFPELDKSGAVVHPEGSKAAANQARARSFSSAPNTGGVNTGEGGAETTGVEAGTRAEPGTTAEGE